MFEKKSIFIATFFLLFPGTAFAYVDPGTGAYLLQLLITVFGAVMFYISRPGQLFKVIREFFSRKNKK
jgi:hypothetical protein